MKEKSGKAPLGASFLSSVGSLAHCHLTSPAQPSWMFAWPSAVCEGVGLRKRPAIHKDRGGPLLLQVPHRKCNVLIQICKDNFEAGSQLNLDQGKYQLNIPHSLSPMCLHYFLYEFMDTYIHMFVCGVCWHTCTYTWAQRYTYKCTPMGITTCIFLNGYLNASSLASPLY